MRGFEPVRLRDLLVCALSVLLRNYLFCFRTICSDSARAGCEQLLAASAVPSLAELTPLTHSNTKSFRAFGKRRVAGPNIGTRVAFPSPLEGSEAMKVSTNVKADEAMSGCQTCKGLKNNLAKVAMTYWNTVQVNRTVASAHPDKAAAEAMVCRSRTAMDEAQRILTHHLRLRHVLNAHANGF